MKTKPYGIFEIVEGNKIPIENVKQTLDRLLIHINEGREGEKHNVWSWEEVVVSISNYVRIMQNEFPERNDE